MVLLRTAIFTLVVPGTVTVLVPYLLSVGRPIPLPVQLGLLRYTGVLPMLLGAAIYLWCSWDFTFAGQGTPAPIDPPRALVVRGLYRYVRNPMYIGICLLLLGEAVLFESSSVLVYAAGVFITVHLFVLLYEEPALRRRFGASYEQYCQSVPRWIPRIVHPGAIG